MNTIILSKEAQRANGQSTAQPVTVNGTPGETKGLKPGQRVKVAWNPDRPAIIGVDGRLYYVVEE